MNRSNKQLIINKTLEMLEEYRGIAKTLYEWQTIINQELPKRYYISNTKEMAQKLRRAKISSGQDIRRKIYFSNNQEEPTTRIITYGKDLPEEELLTC